jgi:Mg2+ and Co2+ transporter CorA
MFGFLPGWVGDVLTLAAFVLGPSGFVWAFLQQKGANRRLKVDEITAESTVKVQEGALTVDQFNAALPAYKDLLDRSNHDRDEAIDKMEQMEKDHKSEVAKYKRELSTVNANQRRLIRLLRSIVKQNNIILTEEQLAELETTQPKAS